MKTLDLNAYGVSEMGMAQLQEVDGGCLGTTWGAFWKAVGIGAAAYLSA